MRTINQIDTPALLVDMDILQQNISHMQRKANKASVNLRPHVKTHRTPALAKIQLDAGAKGITVAKIGEAEIMAQHGMDDIFIANVTMGDLKLKRLLTLASSIQVAIGVDSITQIMALDQVFQHSKRPLNVLIEIEVGEFRTGLRPGKAVLNLARQIVECKHLHFKGVFMHEGHVYQAPTKEACRNMMIKAQQEILKAAHQIQQIGIEVEVVSIGSTPSLLFGEILPGITEIRPGTYALLDAAQGHALGHYEQCAATILATVVSKPEPYRVVLDAGVKALTASVRGPGICETAGYGLLKGFSDLTLTRLYDEHGVIEDENAWRTLALGDRVEVIPNHICPTCNLYDWMYLHVQGEIKAKVPVLCRGRSQ